MTGCHLLLGIDEVCTVSRNEFRMVQFIGSGSTGSRYMRVIESFYKSYEVMAFVIKVELPC